VLVYANNQRRGDVRRCRHTAARAQPQPRRDVVVIAVHHVEGLPHAVEVGRQSAQVAAGVLDPDDLRRLAQPRQRLWLHADARAPGQVVYQRGYLDALGHAQEVLAQLLLAGGDEVRGDQRDRVGSRALGIPREVNALPGGDGPRAGCHGNAARHLVHHRRDEEAALFAVDRLGGSNCARSAQFGFAPGGPAETPAPGRSVCPCTRGLGCPVSSSAVGTPSGGMRGQACPP